MPGEIPEARFRLNQTYAVQPELTVDEGPGRGIVIGQNAPRETMEAIYLGKQAETPHRNVWMDIRGAHVIYVMGKRRSGKSYTLGAIAEGLISDGWVRQGQSSQGVLILDTMNVFLTMPFAVKDFEKNSSDAVKELQRWRLPPSPSAINLFSPLGATLPDAVYATTITLRASDLEPEEWCGLFEIDPFVDAMGHLLTTLHAKVALEGWVDKGTGKRTAGQSRFTLTDLLLALDRDRDLDGFPQDTRRALKRRFDALTRLPLFGTDGLDVRQLIQPGGVSVLLLRDLDQELRSVMVSLIVKRMMRLRAVSEQQERLISLHLARAEKLADSDPNTAKSERSLADECAKKAEAGLPRCWLIIDEAHNYVPARSTVPSRRPLKKFVDEGRNLGLSIVVATQQPSGLDPSLQRNADLLLVHSLSHHDDITAAQGMINTAHPDEVTVGGRYRISGPRSFETLVRNLPIGYAIVSTDRANRLFPIRIRPRCSVHGGAEY